MADGDATSSVFKRYTALEALQEIWNDQDSDDEDLRNGEDSDSDEEFLHFCDEVCVYVPKMSDHGEKPNNK